MSFHRLSSTARNNLNLFVFPKSIEMATRPVPSSTALYMNIFYFLSIKLCQCLKHKGMSEGNQLFTFRPPLYLQTHFEKELTGYKNSKVLTCGASHQWGITSQLHLRRWEDTENQFKLRKLGLIEFCLLSLKYHYLSYNGTWRCLGERVRENEPDL